MSRIRRTFEELRRNGRTALMPYITMGYPEKESAFELVPALVEGGADLIELGIPFSDPLADGATIQASSQVALNNGMTLELCLEQAEALRRRNITVPFIFMGYYNPLYQMGLSEFAARAAEAGIDGVIVPDLPPEESGNLQEVLVSHGIDLIFLLAPSSSDNRIHLVADNSTGFIYLVALTGVTGARDAVSASLQSFVERVRAVSDLPAAVGFGISTPEQAGYVAGFADGVIVGSALINAIGADSDHTAAARDFVAALRAGIDAGLSGVEPVHEDRSCSTDR